MYSILRAEESQIRKPKGIPKDLRYKLYIKTMFERKELKHTQVAICSQNHQAKVHEQKPHL